MINYLKEAEAIAREAHRTQLEESTGDPYVFHLQRVVKLVKSKDEKATAWLHDVIEDTVLWPIDLILRGMPDRIVIAVIILTHNRNMSYEDYIDQIFLSGNQLARAVKHADLIDHLRPNCPPRLKPRYEKAILRFQY